MERLAIIFDMDGTLVDTSQVTSSAILRTAEEFSLDPPETERILRAIGYNGLSFYRQLFEGVPDERLLEFDQVVKQRERQTMQELGQRVLFPGILELLDELDRAGIGFALASTGEDTHVQTALGCAKIYERFFMIRNGHNDKAAMVGEILKTRPGFRFVMVGDKSFDSSAASANGIPSIGAGYGFSSSEELAPFSAVAGAPGEVLRLARELAESK